MCNRYSQRGSVNQIRQLAKAMSRALATTPATDNLQFRENVYPDQDAPIITNMANDDLELIMARWGFPPIPGQAAPITNIRNLNSPWWRDVNRQYLIEKEYRCLVPFTSFAEPVRDSTWFHMPGVEIACFAGIWRPWKGERLAEQPGQTRRAREERDWKLFSFLTTYANDVVRPIHPKAMPAILSDPKEQTEWLNGGEESLRLQRPLSNGDLAIREQGSE
jgi:putative SOS response-associated peptidase YedK